MLINQVHTSWFMFFRRIYLTYNVGLAAFLLLLEGFSFGIQLFYVFLFVESKQTNRFEMICLQFSAVGMIGVACFVFSLILSKCFQFIRIVWSKEQYQHITKKFKTSFQSIGIFTPRWLDILMQLLLIFLLEFVPALVGVFYFVITFNLPIAFQYFLSIGSLNSIIFIGFWWFCSLIENYKRLFMFCCGRKEFFEKLSDFERKRREKELRRLERTSESSGLLMKQSATNTTTTGSRRRVYKKSFNNNESDVNNNEGDDNEFTIVNVQKVDESINNNRNYGATDMNIDTNSLPQTPEEESPNNNIIGRNRALSIASTKSVEDDMIMFNNNNNNNNEKSTISENNEVYIEDDKDIYQIEKERNVWVVLAWYCCLAGFGIPTPKTIFSYIKRCFTKRGNRVKKKFYFKMIYVWYSLLFILALVGIIVLGVFSVWKVFLLLTVVASCLTVNFLLNRLIFIPPHQPSRKRLLDSWDSDGGCFSNKLVCCCFCWKRFFSLLDRYICFVEEVFYHSPHVIYHASKVLFFTITIIISICHIFEFTDSYVTFFFPWSFTLILTLLYILRFNLHRWYDKFCFSIGRSTAGGGENANSAILEEENIMAEELLSDKIDNNKENNNSSATKRLSESIYSMTESHREEQSKYYKKHLHHHSPHESRTFRYLSILYFQISIFISLSSLILSTFIFIGWISGLLLIILLSLVSFIIFMRVEVDAADSMFAFFVVYLALLGMIFILGNINASVGDDNMYWAKTNHIVHKNESTPPYDICQQEWHGYNIVDYALFSSLAYEIDPYFTSDLLTWFPDCTDCVVMKRENTTIDFYDLYIPKKNLSIISVRGTTIPKDVVQDVDVWKEAGLLQIGSMIGPFSFWPDTLLQDLVLYISKIEELAMVSNSTEESIDKSRYYYQRLDDYISTVKTQRNVILTGHSLGGGLAKIVGSKHQVVAVTFSGPGVVLSQKKFEISQQDINRYCVSVKPGLDLVARIDIDGGIVQNIDCTDSFAQCHSIKSTIKKLISSCGDYPMHRWIDPSDEPQKFVKN
ncbi:hypothetical protein ABK040_013734 [Willaertia magna]